MQPQHIHDALKDYWFPIWNRDQEEDAPTIMNFSEIVDRINLPSLCNSCDMTDLNSWLETRSCLKTSSAPGADGWRNSELKALPTKAVSELIHILSQPEFSGFDEEFMRARVVSLPKRDKVEEACHTRPITVLPSIYRWWTATFTRLIMAKGHQKLQD